MGDVYAVANVARNPTEYMMIDSFADLLVNTGLLQFGRFERDGHPAAVRLSLELATAYPEVLQAIVATVQGVLSNAGCERLLVPSSGIAMGGALSFVTGTPLIYSRGCGNEAVFDLVGAYNAGHRATLIAPTDLDITESLLRAAARVGIVIAGVVVVVGTGAALAHQGERVTLFELDVLVANLRDRGRIPARQAQLALDQIKRG